MKDTAYGRLKEAKKHGCAICGKRDGKADDYIWLDGRLVCKHHQGVTK